MKEPKNKTDRVHNRIEKISHGLGVAIFLVILGMFTLPIGFIFWILALCAVLGSFTD